MRPGPKIGSLDSAGWGIGTRGEGEGRGDEGARFTGSGRRGGEKPDFDNGDNDEILKKFANWAGRD